MDSVGPRACGHVHCAGCGQLGGKVQARLAELELLDAAWGDVRCGRAEYLVGNVDAVHFDSSGATETATERDRRITVLAETRRILDLNARFQLCQSSLDLSTELTTSGAVN